MKILAIGAHPDDIEIFMFGILCVFKKRGDQIFTTIATDGSKGGKNSLNKLIKNRKNETISALKTLSTPNFLNLKDGELGHQVTDFNIIKKNIFNINPDLIITHHSNDYHSDHRALSFSKSCYSHYIPIIFCDTMMGIGFEPSFYVNITEYFYMKTNAILKHKSQKPQRFVKLAKLMNSYRSAQCNAPEGFYAEAFSFNKSFPFSDITKFLPDTMEVTPFDISNQKGFL